MSTTPDHDVAIIEHGDRNHFALSVRFVADPEPEDQADRALAASWGDLCIWARGRNLCAHRVDRDERDAVRWYLLPLLEWLATAWDPLLHEERLPGISEEAFGASALWDIAQSPPADDDALVGWFTALQDWLERHSLQAAREGGLFPPLFIRRRRARIELSWDTRHSAGREASLDFVQSGSQRILLEPGEMATVLHSVLNDAVARLAEDGATSTRLAELIRTVEGLPARQRTDTRLAWLAGLGATTQDVIPSWHRVREAISSTTSGASQAAQDAIFGEVSNGLVVKGHSRAALLFGSLSPTVTARDAHVLAERLVSLYNPVPDRPELDGLADSVDVEGEPWQQAYDLAEAVHEELQIPTDRAVPVDDIVRRLRVQIDRVRLSDRRARAVCLVSPEHRAGVLINSNYELNDRAEVYRYTLAHELCHLLFDREFGTELAMASGPWAPREVEQRADAFAAMFLMPRPLVRRCIARAKARPETLDVIRGIAAEMQTSITSTIEHLYNLGEIDIVARDRMLQELSFPAPRRRFRRGR